MVFPSPFELPSPETTSLTPPFKAHVSTYKPSPLSFGSPRASPFRRPESPASPSPSFRPTTPTVSPTKVPHTPLSSPTKAPHTPLFSPTKPFSPLSSPSKLHSTTTPFEKSSVVTAPTTPLTSRSGNSSWTPRGGDALRNSSPTRAVAAENPAISILSGGGRLLSSVLDSGDVLAKLPAGQVREMREGFQILDRDNDGRVTREDLVDMLSNLGLDTSPTSLNAFFPPSSSNTTTTISLPHYLSTLSAPLSQLSSQAELLSAFAAFDTDDSGQIDVAELRDALVNTGGHSLAERDVEEVLASFSGRRAFGAKGPNAVRGGEVFRYRDFVGGLGMGTGAGAMAGAETGIEGESKGGKGGL